MVHTEIFDALYLLKVGSFLTTVAASAKLTHLYTAGAQFDRTRDRINNQVDPRELAVTPRRRLETLIGCTVFPEQDLRL